MNLDLNDVKVSIFKHCKSPKVKREDSLLNVLNYIRTNNNPLIIEARQIAESYAGKEFKVDKRYSKIKEFLLETVTFSATFNYRSKGKRKNINPIIYLDVDLVDIDRTREILKNIPEVLSIWKSVSGRGLGFLIYVEGLNFNNFENTWLSLRDKFSSHGITLDENPKDYSRQNVLSFDKDIFINSNPIPYHTINNKELTKGATSGNIGINFKKEKKQFTPFCPQLAPSTDALGETPDTIRDFLHNKKERLNYRTVLDDYEGKDYLIIEEGKLFKDIFIRRKIETGKRKLTLYAIATTLIYNNPSVDPEILIRALNCINKDKCFEPLPFREVEEIFNNLYNQEEIMFYGRNRYVWFNPNSKIPRNIKLSICGTYSGKRRREKTKAMIVEAIVRLYDEGKEISFKTLATATGKHIKTIKKYYEILENEIKEINKIDTKMTRAETTTCTIQKMVDFLISDNKKVTQFAVANALGMSLRTIKTYWKNIKLAPSSNELAPSTINKVQLAPSKLAPSNSLIDLGLLDVFGNEIENEEIKAIDDVADKVKELLINPNDAYRLSLAELDSIYDSLFLSDTDEEWTLMEHISVVMAEKKLSMVAA